MFRQLDKRDLVRLSVPVTFWGATFDKISEESIREQVKDYCRGFTGKKISSPGILISGEDCVGKTSVATLILRHARSWGFVGFYLTVWEFREYTRARMMFDEELSMLDRCRTVDCLVLDDFGSGDNKNSMFGDRFLEGLIVYRCQRGFNTIITTSLRGEVLNDALGGMNRLVENYLAHLDIVGPNLRKQNLEEKCGPG